MKTNKDLRIALLEINSIEVERAFCKSQSLINIKLIEPFTEDYDAILSYLESDTSEGDEYVASLALRAFSKALSIGNQKAVDAGTAVYATASSQPSGFTTAVATANVMNSEENDYTQAIDTINNL